MLTLHAEDTRHEVPAADAFGAARHVRIQPHIWSTDEIARLMQATAILGPEGGIRPLTYRTLFGLLAATGLRISEALALRVRDVTDDGLLVLGTKFRKNRLVPIHETTRGALDVYLATHPGHPDDPLFRSAKAQKAQSSRPSADAYGETADNARENGDFCRLAPQDFIGFWAES